MTIFYTLSCRKSHTLLFTILFFVSSSYGNAPKAVQFIYRVCACAVTVIHRILLNRLFLTHHDNSYFIVYINLKCIKFTKMYPQLSIFVNEEAWVQGSE